LGRRKRKGGRQRQEIPRAIQTKPSPEHIFYWFFLKKEKITQLMLQSSCFVE
jgi:hypothetical protein